MQYSPFLRQLRNECKNNLKIDYIFSQELRNVENILVSLMPNACVCVYVCFHFPFLVLSVIQGNEDLQENIF